jgi:WD40 repeat protein
VLAGHTDHVLVASFSPDGARIVTASVDGTARVWDAASGKELARLAHESDVRSAFGVRIVAHEGSVRSAVFSSDGARIVTTSDDNTARVWDAARHLW